MQITTVGLDLAKHIFQVHAVDDAGQVVARKRLRRTEMLSFFAGLSPCLIGMEACATSHHWARELTKLGHIVKLMPPAYVKAYVKRGKTDAADAEAICEAVTRPSMRFVPISWPDRSTQRAADQRYDATYAGGMRVPCVGAVILDPDGRLLLIRRGHPPAVGAWSIPGGRVEPGESDTEALTREVLEETGLAVTVGRLVGTVDRSGPGGTVYEIRDYACTVTGGLLAPGDDARDARWVSGADLAGLPLTTGLVETLREWGVLS